jgi:very-short-patch-repair endonuclease
MADAFARALRKAMTPQEVRLWVYLRELRHTHGFRFRRQVPLRDFIVDFVCFRPKVVIELDGSQRAGTSHAASDRERDTLLERFGFSVLRFWNVEIDSEFDGV